MGKWSVIYVTSSQQAIQNTNKLRRPLNKKDMPDVIANHLKICAVGSWEIGNGNGPKK
jgi:hypothetical protein